MNLQHDGAWRTEIRRGGDLIELPQLERFADLLALFDFVLVAVLATSRTRGCLHGSFTFPASEPASHSAAKYLMR